MNISVQDKTKLYYWALGLYYSILLLLALTWTNRGLVVPNVILRYLFLLFFVLPFIKFPNLAPSLITLFVTVRIFSIAPYGYLPSQVNLYFYLAVVLYLYNLSCGLSSSKTAILLLVFLLTSLFSNLINFVTESQDSGEYNFLKMLLISILLSKLLKSRKDINLMEWSFILITLCLSIYGFIFHKEIASDFNSPDELKRVYWNDPNYLGCVLSIGIIISFYRLLTNLDPHRIYRIIYLATFFLGIVNLGFFASRGAFLATVIPLLYIFFKKARSLKSVFLALGVIFVLIIIILNTPVFNSLINRFKDESTSTGSERTIIWERSFDLFSYSDPKILIFGGGSTYSYHLCGRAMNSVYTSPHNNFLEILYDYGIVGLAIFILLLINWFRKNSKNILGTSLILILILSSLTLSPLMYLPFWFLILLIENHKFG